MRVLSKPKHLLFTLLLLLAIYSTAEAQNPHDIYDLRVGVERYYTPCIPIPDFISCGLSYYTYRVERVLENVEFEGNLYARIERRAISNEQSIVSRDTLYQRLDGNMLIQRQGTEEVMLFRFDFVPLDSIKHFYNDPEPDNKPYQFTNSSVITADTTITFPDGQEYRVVFGSDGTYPWGNARLVSELSLDWNNTVFNPGTLGFDKIGLNWLVPFSNMAGNWDTPPFYIGMQTFYHISRFGPILSKSHTGLRYLAGFKSHDGQVYGYFHDGIPVGIDRNDGEAVSGYHLLGNYPNPFNPSTVIKFQLSQISEIRLEVLNILGQQVALPITNAVHSAGVHEVGFDAYGLSSGIYFYRLIVRSPGSGITSEGISMGKMLLIK